MLKLVSVIGTLSLVGCMGLSKPVARFDENTVLNPQKATIVGLISEGFINEPQGLSISIQKQTSAQTTDHTTLNIDTLGIQDEDLTPDILGNTFVFQVPAGTYNITKWSFTKSSGHSLEAPKPLRFTVAAGEVAYIGNLHSNALTLCLSNKDDYTLAIKDIKFAHPILDKTHIVNKSTALQFNNWAHSHAKDITGNGLCQFM